MSILPQLFYARRKALGLTQDEVADTGLISRSTYKRIEQGISTRSPSLRIVQAIANALGCDLCVTLIPHGAGEDEGERGGEAHARQ